jgi:hypothetical protein
VKLFIKLPQSCHLFQPSFKGFLFQLPLFPFICVYSRLIAFGFTGEIVCSSVVSRCRSWRLCVR